MTTFNEPQHQSDEAARKWFEALRWPDGVVCPHCGSINRAYARKRPGLYRCAEKECRKDFTVTTKSVLESSHIPLRLWAQAFTLLCSSKKGISAHQVHRTLKITYKSAWFLCHRIREAMRQGGLATLGGEGTSGIVEADETYYGKVEPAKRRATRRDGDATRLARAVLQTSARSWRWWSAAAMSARSCAGCRSAYGAENHPREHCPRSDAAHRRKSPLHLRYRPFGGARNRQTFGDEYVRIRMALLSTPIQRKATSQSSNVACAAFISIAQRSTCTATWRNMISATIIVSSLVIMTGNARPLR